MVIDLEAVAPMVIMCAIFVGVMRTLFKGTRAARAEQQAAEKESSKS